MVKKKKKKLESQLVKQLNRLFPGNQPAFVLEIGLKFGAIPMFVKTKI